MHNLKTCGGLVPILMGVQLIMTIMKQGYPEEFLITKAELIYIRFGTVMKQKNYPGAVTFLLAQGAFLIEQV